MTSDLARAKSSFEKGNERHFARHRRKNPRGFENVDGQEGLGPRKNDACALAIPRKPRNRQI